MDCQCRCHDPRCDWEDECDECHCSADCAFCFGQGCDACEDPGDDDNPVPSGARAE